MLSRRLTAFVLSSFLAAGALDGVAQAQKSATAPAAKPAAPAKTGPIPSSWQKVPIPPLPKFSPQEPIRVQLNNGMVIFLQPNHELPLIDATLRIRGGSRSEPADKVGLLDMYGDVWRTGGTEQRTGDQLDDFLEARAAKVETGSNADSTFISLSCLKGDFDSVFQIFMELLEHPAFRAEKLDLSKKQMYTAISRRNDDIDSIAGREGAKLVYGAENPYARVAEYATVGAVTREDLVAWHKQHNSPNNMIFGITGDFDAKEMEAKLRQTFDSWPKGAPTEPPHITPTPAQPGLYFVNKTDVNQSSIQMVGLGIERKNPDYFSLQVMNEVLGGGFSSRLFQNLRTKQGLAYAVGGGIGSAWDHLGMADIEMGTKSATTVEGIKGLWQQLDELHTSPPTEEELKRGKDNILNSFIFRFDTPGKVLRERMAYEYYGYPSDWLERYRSAIDKVTTADVKRVIDKYVHKDQLAVLVVGNSEEFKPALNTLGPVKDIDITIPPPPGAEKANEKPTASNPEGKALIGKVVEFLGGAEKVKALKSLRYQATSTRVSPQGEIPIETDTTVEFPDKLASSMSAMGNEMKIVITPTAAFRSGGGEVQDMPSSMRADALQTAKQQVYNVAQHADDPAYVFAANGTEKVGNVDAAVLSIAGDGSAFRWLVNPSTGELLEAVSEVNGRQGPTERTITFSDWKTVDGVKFYNQRTVSEGGSVVAKDTIKSWTVNPPVDPKMFEKPAQNQPQ
ncbi:MAG TPA: pitrilysin family protein [Terriglobales bacterium]|nr:pitrilysin family protein [Terriglobales bacterium]